ncbi:hypothetical protein BDW59DRAFT_54388 [Aspergillus cavernicola]|uniref:C2H2-type domain-containing protein n=1 Tax=Aspergillus cavernicola TaxID=176166 RepID=A0ABR4IIX8_9EURO
MGTAFEPYPPQPLNARRPAAPPLPTFELPAPTFNATPLKYPPQSHLQSHLQSHPLHHHLPPPQPPNPSVSNLIQTTQAEAISAATTVPPPTTTAAVSASPDSSYWAQGSYNTGRQPSWTPGLGSSYSNRDPFSPSFNPSLHRNPATSTPGADTIPPAYDMNQLPPFHQPLGSAPPAHPMAHPMLNTAPHPSLPSNDPYLSKSSSAPTYGAVQQLSSQPGAYQHYGGPPPPPLAMHHPPRVASNPPPPPPPPHLSYQRHPWPSYSLPAMSGPVMSNVHSPGGQMSMMGPLQSGLLPGFNSGHVASMQQLYGGHPPHLAHGSAGPTNDRPFKCDQCPQSFNRNHDLKRHRRIHLSVKPFPCHHCDKSFSRKDALKRHKLVKGCDKGEDSKQIKEEDKDEEASGEH